MIKFQQKKRKMVMKIVMNQFLYHDDLNFIANYFEATYISKENIFDL